MKHVPDLPGLPDPYVVVVDWVAAFCDVRSTCRRRFETAIIYLIQSLLIPPLSFLLPTYLVLPEYVYNRSSRDLRDQDHPLYSTLSQLVLISMSKRTHQMQSARGVWHTFLLNRHAYLECYFWSYQYYCICRILPSFSKYPLAVVYVPPVCLANTALQLTQDANSYITLYHNCFFVQGQSIL